MNKEELRQRMSKAIGTYETQMIREISETCAEIAMRYYAEQKSTKAISDKECDFPSDLNVTNGNLNEPKPQTD